MSGLLSAMNASKHEHLRKNYIVSKCRKIIPLYWIATIGVYILGRVMPSLFSSMEFTWINLMYSLFLIPGHTFILYPGWTLTYFFLFYIIYWIGDKFFDDRDRATSIIIISIVILGYISGLLFPENLFEKYANPIMLEFLYGIILYHLILKIKLSTIKMKRMKYVGLFLIFFLFFDYNKYLGTRWLLPSIFTCISIICIYNCRLQGKVFEFFAKIGDISFVVYILHPLIIRPCDKIVMKIVGNFTNPVYFLGLFIGMIITIFFCYGVQKFITNIKSTRKLIGRR